VLTILSEYKPVMPNSLDIKVLSRNLTEYQDRKYSNGYFYLDHEDLIKLGSKIKPKELKLLLDNLYGYDYSQQNKELKLYELFKKILMNNASDDDYVNFTRLLDSVHVLSYI